MASPGDGVSGVRNVSGVLIEDISIGKGKEAKSGNKVRWSTLEN